MRVAPAAGAAALGATPGNLQPGLDWLTQTLGLNLASAEQLVEYLARARQAFGALPSQDTLLMERFFDESGGTQLIIHTPFGSRINRAWGLALRKRFCRTFNFELQAAASEDAIVLSLSTSHSFELDDVWRYLHSNSAEHTLIQAVLDAPLFGVRWRWNAGVALALPRYTGGRKVAPQIQRMKSEDLIASVFPDQIACLENLAGEREVPDHPLVEQTLDDCLHEAMDSDAWLALLRRMERGEVRLISRDLPAPSPMAAEILNARPYTFLDDAPLGVGNRFGRKLHAQVAARHHNAVRRLDDLVDVVEPLAVLDLRDDLDLAAVGIEDVLHGLDILGAAHERVCDEIHVVLHGPLDEAAVLLRNRRQVDRYAGDIDALARAHGAADDGHSPCRQRRPGSQCPFCRR